MMILDNIKVFIDMCSFFFLMNHYRIPYELLIELGEKLSSGFEWFTILQSDFNQHNIVGMKE